MATPDQYWNGRQQAPSGTHQPRYLRSRTPSFDNGDDGHLMGRQQAQPSAGERAETPAEELYYDPNFRRDRGNSNTQTDGPSGSDGYFSQPTAGSHPVYENPQDVAQYAQQQPVGAGVPPATYPPQSPGFPPVATTQRTQSVSQHQPYNPAAYQPPPQRNATISYGPQYNSSSYAPASYGSPYPTYKPPGVTQYANMPSARPYQNSTYNPSYLNGPASPTFFNGQYSPGLPPPSVSSNLAATVYQTPPPPPPPAPPATAGYNPNAYAATTPPQPQGFPQYNNTPYQTTPFSTNSTNQMFAGQYHPGSISPPSDASPPISSTQYSDYRHNSADSALGPLPSPPPPAPPAHGIGTVRHPHSRPLPTRPPEEEEFNDSDSTQLDDEQDAIYKDVEAAALGLGSTSLTDRDRRYSFAPPARSDSMQVDPLFATSHSPAQNGINGRNGNGRGPYSDISDMEAEHGLEAMRLAEQQDRLGYSPSKMYPTHAVELDSDPDYTGQDLSLYGGGFPGAAADLYASHSRQNSREDSGYVAELQGSLATVAPDPTAYGGYGYDLPDENSLHPFPSFMSTARVEEDGGLIDPDLQPRRMSYDEGDEDIELPPQPILEDDDDDFDYPELFYHPHASTAQFGANRPLPSLPTELPGSPPAPPVLRKPLPTTAEMVGGGLGRLPVPPVPRSSSLSSHAGAGHHLNSQQQPARSKTDAAVHKRPGEHLRSPSTSVYSDSTYADTDLTTPQSIVTVNDLPAIPQQRRRNFVPEKLSSRDFKECREPWALSGIVGWLRKMTEGESDLKEKSVGDAIIKLFTHVVPTMNLADAEVLAARVVQEMFEGAALVRDEEWVKFGPGQVSGVIYQITGHGCYAPILHNMEDQVSAALANNHFRCYSHHCARTLKKIKLGASYLKDQKKEDWATHWKLRKEDITNVDKKEVERQNNLHEIVQTEEEYMDQLMTLKTVYQDQIMMIQPPIIKPSRMQTFVNDVFGKAEAVRKVNEEYLFPQLKFRQREQGPWILGFSDIFREWVRKAKGVYIEYAANFPRADALIRREVDRNLLFRTFLDACRQDPRTKRLDWVTFLKGPITRLQRYSLLLSTVLKHTLIESDEKRNLMAAIEEIRAVTLECDARVDEVTKKVTLSELNTRLVLRQGMEVNLRLDEKGREIIFKGDLQRNGANRFNWVETHAILFDHYLILAKKTVQRDAAGGAKLERYDVSRKVSFFFKCV